MTNLISTFQKLKEQVSPMAVMPESNNAFRKIYTSEDDPFNDKKGRVLTPKIDVNVTQESKGSPFIRNDNLKELKRDDVHVEHQKITSNETIQKGESKDGGKGTATTTSTKKEETKEKRRKIEEDEDEVPLNVLEEMSKLEECFPVLSSNYRLIDKIGEGTFSTVYKAEALNGTVRLAADVWKSPPLKRLKTDPKVEVKRKTKHKNPIVALKQIYVTSSPNRIYNELNLLYILTGNSHIAPLLDVLRYQDQVLAILPYYPHADFRDFYRDLPIKGIKRYLSELFQGLEFVHNKGVIHRDLKPTNFLFDPFKGKGVLVDFGLAEKDTPVNNYSNQTATHCPCSLKEKNSKNRYHYNHNKRFNVKAAYPKQDQRPPRRANRAGTRGFRAPEVLFKCTNQSTKIDVWSAGIIALSLFARKFPLFNSPDDTDALVELSIVFGLEKLTKCSELHGCGLEINLNHKTPYDGNLLKLVSDSLVYEHEQDALPNDSVIYDTIQVLNQEGDAFNDSFASLKDSKDEEDIQVYDNYKDHKELYELLNGCFRMDPNKRLCSRDILKLPFFSELNENDDDDVIL